MTPSPDHANNRRTVADHERCAGDYVVDEDSTPARIGAGALRRFASAIAPGRRVLEIGSGPGRDADVPETLGLAVHRTDVTAAFRALQAARGRHCAALDVLTDDIAGRYDGILMFYVLQHFERAELPGVLRKLVGALHGGGALLLSYAEGIGDHRARTDDGDYRVMHWTRADFDAQLVQAGLGVEWTQAFQGSEWPWRIVLARRAA